MRLPLLATIGTGLLLPLAPAAHATGTVRARATVLYDRARAGGQVAVVSCGGYGSVPDTVSITLTCTISDAANTTTRTTSAPGPAHVVVVTVRAPLGSCVVSVRAIATFADGTTATDEARADCPDT
jgi:hypothetical protein